MLFLKKKKNSVLRTLLVILTNQEIVCCTIFSDLIRTNKNNNVDLMNLCVRFMIIFGIWSKRMTSTKNSVIGIIVMRTSVAWKIDRRVKSIGEINQRIKVIVEIDRRVKSIGKIVAKKICWRIISVYEWNSSVKSSRMKSVDEWNWSTSEIDRRMKSVWKGNRSVKSSQGKLVDEISGRNQYMNQIRKWNKSLSEINQSNRYEWNWSAKSINE